MESVQEENLKLQSLVFQQKREKMAMTKRYAELETKYKQQSIQLENYKKIAEEAELTMKAMKDHIAKSETVINKLNLIVKQLLKNDETHKHDISQSCPKTNQREDLSKKRDLQQGHISASYQEEHSKLDLQEQIISQYSKKQSSNQIAKLPHIEQHKPIAVTILKTKLKRVNPHELIAQQNNEIFNYL